MVDTHAPAATGRITVGRVQDECICIVYLCVPVCVIEGFQSLIVKKKGYNSAFNLNPLFVLSSRRYIAGASRVCFALGQTVSPVTVSSLYGRVTRPQSFVVGASLPNIHYTIKLSHIDWSVDLVPDCWGALPKCCENRQLAKIFITMFGTY